MAKIVVTTQPKNEQEPSVVQPPSSVNVDFERKPVLYTADGKVLVRRAGF